MKVILIQDYKSLGKKYDVVEVKNGFAKHLFTRGIAIRYDLEKNQFLINRLKAEEQQLKEDRLEQAALLKAKLNNKELIKMSVGTPYNTARLTINSKDLAALFADTYGVNIDHRQIKIMPKKINCFGTYDFTVKLDSGLEAKMRFKLVRQL